MDEPRALNTSSPTRPLLLATHEQAARRTRSMLRAQRALDVVLSTLLLIALGPLTLLVAATVLLIEGRPVVFWQTRVGQNGRPFAFPKFRSMQTGTAHPRMSRIASGEHSNDVTFKMRNDPRITPLGRLLRTTSLDELPQLWSVLRGDMSLVGPRPPLPDEVARYTPRQRRRLDVKPGLTCLWQISGRSELSFSRQVDLDLEYIETWSVWGDLKLIALTIPAVLSCRGAM